MTRGIFITLEGGEGAGKSTQGRRLAERLTSLGRAVTLTREPGGSPGAEAIRDLLVRGAADRWSPMSETLLMYAARRDHIERTIQPALRRGEMVICDRFLDSTRAYQGAGGGVGSEFIASLEAAVVGEVMPDRTVIFDLSVEAGLARAANRGDDEGRFESKGRIFHERLRAAYRSIADEEPERCVVVDAVGSLDEVAERVWAAVLPVLDIDRG